MNKKVQSFRLENGKITPFEKTTKGKDEEENKDLFKSIGLASDLGFSIAIPIAGGAILGSILDNKLNTRPFFTLFLLFLGILISFFNIYNIVKKNSN